MTSHDRVVRDTTNHALRKPWILSVGLAAIVIIVFIVNVASTPADVADQTPAWSFEHLAMIPGFVDNGQVYRLWAAALLHSNLWSLIATVLTLLVVGTEVEARWGSRRYLGTLFTLALAAGTAVLYFEPAISRFATGGGAAMGIMGAAFVVARRARFRIWALLLVAAFDIIIYLTVADESSVWAAVGGFVGGAIIALLLIAAPRDERRNRWQFIALGSFFVLLCLFVALHIALFAG